jgi:CPA2 family monovalent cation:H+ antiporter-2
MFHEADLAVIQLAPNSSAVGKLIREVELRTQTGASIVGIQRDGTKIINPDPDEELKSGDQVMLLGTGPQLDSAKAKLQTTV